MTAFEYTGMIMSAMGSILAVNLYGLKASWGRANSPEILNSRVRAQIETGNYQTSASMGNWHYPRR